MALTSLIFDVDGTLAETEEVHRQAFNEIFEERGFDWHWSREKYSLLLKVTGGVERITHFLRTDHDGVFSDRRLGPGCSDRGQAELPGRT